MSPDQRPQLEGVEIRALAEGDIDDVIDLFHQPGCVRGTLQSPYRSPLDIREQMLKVDAQRHTLVAVVRDQGRDRVVGMIGLHRHPRPRRSHSASLGMQVHDDFQGRGIGTRLMEAALDLAVNWLHIERIELGVFVDNEPAIRLYEKLGFQREGVYRKYAWRDGEYVDTIAMAWLRDDG
ncbi:MAG: GNAT family N-acetyltransferase [Planctomycetota bacterium]